MSEKGPVCIAVWVLLLAVSSRAVAQPSSEVYAEQWGAWKSTQGRSYESEGEEALRYSIWLDNVDYIEQHNADADQHGFSLKMNAFGDLSLDEWKTFYKCHHPEDIDDAMPPTATPPKSPASNSSVSALPSSFDWRERHKVTNVKNQNEYRCHSCYAFASVAALETAHAIKTGKLLSLSAQQIVDCSRMYYNGGCNGGNFRHVWMYIMDNGITSNAAYPYKSVAGSCHYKGENEQEASMMYYRLLEGGEEDILKTVAEQNPVVVSIDHRTRTFMFYSSGVYSNHLCSTQYEQLTHEMVVVGYGPSSSSGTPYWIVKNSYGAGWGTEGYIHMARGKNVCGIAVDAAYPIV